MDLATSDDHAMIKIITTGIQQVLIESTILAPWKWMEVILWIVVALIGVFCMRAMAHKRRPKNPVDWPLVGMLPALIANMHNFYDWFSEILIDNGGSFQFWGPWFTKFNYFTTIDPRNVEHVLRLKFSNYPKGPDFHSIFHDLLGNGIFNVDDELWRMQRKASSLQLKSQECKSYTSAAIIKSVNNKLLPILSHLSTARETVDLQDLMLRFTFDTMCMVGFGVDTGYLSPELPFIPFASAFETALDCTTLRFFIPSSWWRTFRFLRLGKESHMPSCLVVIDRFINHVITTRRLELQVNNTNNNPSSKADLLSCFMKLGVDSCDDKFLKDISINFLLAGRDTSALALSWFFWLVSTHPHVEEKLVNEVNQVIGSSDKFSLSPEKLNQMTYLHAALSESLRLYPSVPIEVKHILEDDILPDGNHVKKNDRLIFNIYGMGRMESIWGSDSRSFRPERWFSDDGTSCVSHISPFQYPAFNAGPRICLGKDMAYFLMKTVASTLLYNFKISVVPGHKVVPKLSITLYMKHGLFVTLEPRKPLEA